jgi:uncharacterized membrane protein YdfJ with MMPL/SSD domain
MILLVLVFRSAVAAGLPLAIGLITMFGSLTVLRVLTNDEASNRPAGRCPVVRA